MNSKKGIDGILKNKTFIWVGISVIVAGGLYLIYRRNKLKSQEQQKKATDDSAPNDTEQKVSKTASKYTFPFKSIGSANIFRNWVNNKYPKYAQSIKLSREGELNSTLQTAWDKYGAEYLNVISKSDKKQPEKETQVADKEKDLIKRLEEIEKQKKEQEEKSLGQKIWEATPFGVFTTDIDERASKLAKEKLS